MAIVRVRIRVRVRVMVRMSDNIRIRVEAGIVSIVTTLVLCKVKFAD